MLRHGSETRGKNDFPCLARIGAWRRIALSLSSHCVDARQLRDAAYDATTTTWESWFSGAGSRWIAPRTERPDICKSSLKEKVDMLSKE
jgi:hypothetical protein